MEFRFSEVEQILARAFEVDKGNATAFRGRLNYYKRPAIRCIPNINHEGAGIHTKYTLDHLKYYTFVISLNRMGIDPTFIREIVIQYEGHILDWFGSGEQEVLKNLTNPELLYREGPWGAEIKQAIRKNFIKTGSAFKAALFKEGPWGSGKKLDNDQNFYVAIEAQALKYDKYASDNHFYACAGFGTDFLKEGFIRSRVPASILLNFTSMSIRLYGGLYKVLGDDRFSEIKKEVMKNGKD